MNHNVQTIDQSVKETLHFRIPQRRTHVDEQFTILTISATSTTPEATGAEQSRTKRTFLIFWDFTISKPLESKKLLHLKIAVSRPDRKVRSFLIG